MQPGWAPRCQLTLIDANRSISATCITFNTCSPMLCVRRGLYQAVGPILRRSSPANLVRAIRLSVDVDDPDRILMVKARHKRQVLEESHDRAGGPSGQTK
jgi:hypothetical protein